MEARTGDNHEEEWKDIKGSEESHLGQGGVEKYHCRPLTQWCLKVKRTYRRLFLKVMQPLAIPGAPYHSVYNDTLNSYALFQ
jgi:TorA maturation chaperone TorD